MIAIILRSFILESNLFWSELKINDALVEDLSSFINLINKFNKYKYYGWKFK